MRTKKCSFSLSMRRSLVTEAEIDARLHRGKEKKRGDQVKTKKVEKGWLSLKRDGN